MPQVPAPFPLLNDAKLTNYDWTDLASGTGYVTYYGVNTFDGSTFLSPNRLDSYNWYYGAAPPTTEQQVHDLDFDVTFDLPQTIDGILYVTHTYAVTNNNGVNTMQSYTKVRVYHYDGSTETEIGAQVTTTTLAAGGVGQVQAARPTIQFDITRQFKAGETLRVNFEVWAWISSGSSSYAFYADGSNRGTGAVLSTPQAITGHTANTDIQVQVPFKIFI